MLKSESSTASLTSSSGSKIIKPTIKEASEELIIEHKPTSYWQRHKKPTVDYLHGSPFASDRQLEDQRYLIEQNRNPQLNNPTKVDKPRSIQISQRTGISRPIAIKANVLNKIVREASGIHTYTMVPPPRAADPSIHQHTVEKLDPETNPHFRAYAKEAKQKPVLVSFGHRPKSASRTFHPSTMKFRLKHGELIPTDSKRTTIGLPVDILDKVLHAPKIISPFEAAKLEESKSSPTTRDGTDAVGTSAHTTGEFGNTKQSYEDLFFTKEQQAEMLGAGSSIGDLSSFNGSWISSKRSKKKVHKLQPVRLINNFYDISKQFLMHFIIFSVACTSKRRSPAMG